MNAKLRIRSTLLIILSVLICLSSAPYLTHYLFGSYYVLFSGLCSLLLFFTVFPFRKIKIDNWIKILLVFITSFLLYGCLMMLRDGTLHDIRKFVGMFIKVLFIFGSIIIIRKKYNSYLSFIFGINIVIIILSILLFILLFIGIDIPSISFTKLDGRSHSFFWIGATNIILNLGGSNIIRIAGFADEPGAFALIITYLLVLNEFTYQSLKIRILLVIAGSLSFSLAFFITLPLFCLYWVLRSLITLKSMTIILCFILLLWLAVNSIPSLEGLKLSAEFLIFERFEISSEVEADVLIKGDNRSHAIPVQKQAFKNNPILGVGANPDNLMTYMLGYPNFFSYLALHGIYGYLFFYIPFFALMYKYRKRKEIILFLALLLNYMQRPSIEDMFAMICFSLIYYSSLFNSDNKRLKEQISV